MMHRGMMGGGGMNSGSGKGLRIDPKADLVPPPPPPQQQQTYYYQQQQGIPTMYGGLGSPMMSPLNSPQLSMYIPAPGPPPNSLLDYSPSARRPMKGRKGFVLDSDHMQQQQVQQQSQQQQQSSWYNAMPPHMSYMQSPGLSLAPHSPVSLSSLQSQQIQQNNALTMAMLGSPLSSLHRRADSSPPNLQQQQQQQQPQQGSPTYSGSVTLNISNLPAHADVALLHDLFSPYGRILSAQIDVDQSAQSRLGSAASRVSICSGRGRVQMAGLPQAEFAAHALSGAIVCEGGLPIQVQLSFR